MAAFVPNTSIERSVSAAVLTEPGGKFSLDELSLVGLDADQVLVAIAGTGLCHTDLVMCNVPFSQPGPRILGHEGAGIVEAVGVAVRDLSVGDHVVLSFNSCGMCVPCRRGAPYYCYEFGPANDAVSTERPPQLTDAGATPVHHNFFGQSSFASHVLTTSRNTVRIDDDLPIDIMGPLGCGILTGAGAVINALGVRPGMSVAVYGAGAVGLSAVMAAKICGAGRIIAVDLHQSRLDLATELGATETFLGSEPDLTSRIAASGGVDRAFDTTGASPVINVAVDSLVPGGICGLVGIGGPIQLNPFSLVLGRTVTGIIEGNSVPQVLIPQLASWWREGIFPFDKLVTKFELGDIASAIEASASGSVVKPVLIP